MGAVVSCVSPGGRSLLSASSQGLADNVREVLEVRPELAIFTFFSHQYNVMHHAAAQGHVEVLKAVVEVLQSSAAQVAGCESTGELKEPSITALTWQRFVKDVMNARTLGGKTPLMLACENGRVACVEYLLSQGADAFAVDKNHRRSAIHCAVVNVHADVLKALLSDNAKVHTEDGQVPLRDVRVHDMSGQCRYVDSRAENGLTALHMAAALGDLGCVQALLAAGASMMVRTVDLDMTSALQFPAGSTPLHLAASRGHIAILQAMLQAHADALGTWGAGVRGTDGQVVRRAWEGDGRIDLRSVTNCLRQLPYHVAWQRGFRQAATVLNPTIAIDVALETARDLEDGYGPQKLATLAAFALRRNLLDWLETFKVEKLCAERMRARAHLLKQQQQQQITAEASQQQAAPAAAVEAAAGSRAAGKASGASSAAHRLPRRSCSAIILGNVVEAEDEGATSNKVQRDSDAPASHPQESDSHRPGSSEPGSDRSQEGPTSSGASSSAKRVGFVAGASSLPAGTSTPALTPELQAPPQPTFGVSPFEQAALNPFTLGDAAGSSRATSIAGDDIGGRLSTDGAAIRAKSASAPSVPRSRAGSFLQETMAGRLQELERAVTSDPLEGGSDGGYGRREEGGLGLSRRALSVGLVRKSSASIRRTISSLRRGSRSDAGGVRLTGDHSRAASISGFEPELEGVDDDCGICLENDLDVAINGCRHRLCIDCAIRLCEVNKKPPLCPFCRNFIEGFHNCYPCKQ